MSWVTCDILSSHSGCQENQVPFVSSVILNNGHRQSNMGQPLAVRCEMNAEMQFGSLSFGQCFRVSSLADGQDQTPKQGESL